MISGDRLPTIETPRLRLRWMEARDVPALFEIFGDAETVRYWSRPALQNLGEAEGYLADIHRRFAEHSLYQWGVAKRDDDRVIGTCSLFDLSAPHKRAEIGFAIHRAEWRKGFASEASGAIAQYAFDVLRLHRLDADVDPRNHGSIRCLEGLGFQKEGYARECYHVGDEIQDSVLYGLLARELHRR